MSNSSVPEGHRLTSAIIGQSNLHSVSVTLPMLVALGSINTSKGVKNENCKYI